MVSASGTQHAPSAGTGGLCLASIGGQRGSVPPMRSRTARCGASKDRALSAPQVSTADRGPTFDLTKRRQSPLRLSTGAAIPRSSSIQARSFGQPRMSAAWATSTSLETSNLASANALTTTSRSASFSAWDSSRISARREAVAKFPGGAVLRPMSCMGKAASDGVSGTVPSDAPGKPQASEPRHRFGCGFPSDAEENRTRHTSTRSLTAPPASSMPPSAPCTPAPPQACEHRDLAGAVICAVPAPVTPVVGNPRVECSACTMMS